MSFEEQTSMQKIREEIRQIQKALNSNLYFAAEARTANLLDLIRELPSVEKYRVNPREKQGKFDYLISSPDR